MIFAYLPVALVLATGAAQPALAQSPSTPTAWSGLYLGLLGVATQSTENMLRVGVTYTFGGGLSAGTGQDIAAARD